VKPLSNKQVITHLRELISNTAQHRENLSRMRGREADKTRTDMHFRKRIRALEMAIEKFKPAKVN